MRSRSSTTLSVALLALVAALSGCQKSSTINDDEFDLAIVGIKSDAIQNRVNRLENNAFNDYAAFRRGDTQWSWLTTRSLSVRVKAEILKAADDGAVVRIGVANPLAMSLSSCSIGMQWAEVGPDKRALKETWRKDIHLFNQPIESGTKLTQDLTLPGIAYDKLGIVTLHDIICLGIGDS